MSDESRRPSATDAALRASERKFAAAFDQSPLALTITSLADGRLVEVNASFLRLSGYTRAEVIGRTPEELNLWVDPAERASGLERLRSGGSLTGEIRFRTKQGDERIGAVGASVIEIDGRPHVLTTVADVTDRSRAEGERRELLAREREARNETEALYAVALALAAELDLHAVVQKATDAATELTGAKFGAFFYSVTDESGESLLLYTLSGAPREAFEKFGVPRNTPLFAPTFTGSANVRIADVLHDPRYGHNPPHHGMPAGHLPVRSYLSVPVVSRSGAVLGGLFFGHPDVGVFTERAERLVVGIAAQSAIAIDNARLYAEAQQEIARRKQAEETLQRDDRRKNEFLATLAHELRNPLAPIRNATEILKRAGVTPGQAEWGRAVIDRQVTHMARLLDDLLDLSRISRDRLELRHARIVLTAVIEAAVETSQPVIDANRHALQVALPPDPVVLSGDLTRLAQVFANLLNNAAKFTPPGGHITITAERRPGAVRVSVTDDGVGLDGAVLPHVFEMFRQGTSADVAQSGLGIGLSLARQLVRLHGGDIEARSAGIGAGSEFIVQLPTQDDERAQPIALADQSNRAPARKQRILVVDDRRDAADSLALLLSLNGHETHAAYDGEEAIAVAEALGPDIVLLDIGMPGLNGYETAERIRTRPWAAKTLLVALTGWGQEHDRRRALEAGFDQHLTKPVDPAVLEGLIAAFNRGQP